MGRWDLVIADGAAAVTGNRAALGQSELTQGGVRDARDSLGRERVGRLPGRPSSRPAVEEHGRGSLDDWQLLITDAQGNEHVFLSEVRVQIESLPRWGKLYAVGSWTPEEYTLTGVQLGDYAAGSTVVQTASAQALIQRLDGTVTGRGTVKTSVTQGTTVVVTVESGVFIRGTFIVNGQFIVATGVTATKASSERGAEFPVMGGRAAHWQPCYGNCAWKYGHGAKVNFYTVNDSIAATAHQPNEPYRSLGHGMVKTSMNFMGGERTLLYSPGERYVGNDSFTFRVFLGLHQAPKLGSVDITVRDCRKSASFHAKARPSTWLGNGGSGGFACQNDIVDDMWTYDWVGRAQTGGGENSGAQGMADDMPGVPKRAPLPTDRVRPRTFGFNDHSLNPNIVYNEETFYNPANLDFLGQNPGSYVVA
jgi:hypothetical protein